MNHQFRNMPVSFKKFPEGKRIAEFQNLKSTHQSTATIPESWYPAIQKFRNSEIIASHLIEIGRHKSGFRIH